MEEELPEEELTPQQVLEEVQAQLSRLRSLVKSPGWDDLVEILENRAKYELEQLLMPLTMEDGVDGMTAILQNELAKGFRNGLLFARNIVDNTIEELERDQGHIQDMIEDQGNE